jgi:hypothetical protein
MSRLDKPTDFSALLEKYADCPLFSRSASNIDRERSNSTPSRNEVIRARLSSRFRTASRLTLSVYTQPMPEAQKLLACKISSVLLRSAPKSEVQRAEAEVVIP